MLRLKVLIALAAAWAAPAVAEVDYAAQLKQDDAVLRDFAFSNGEKIAALKAAIMRRLGCLVATRLGGSSMR